MCSQKKSIENMKFLGMIFFDFSKVHIKLGKVKFFQLIFCLRSSRYQKELVGRGRICPLVHQIGLTLLMGGRVDYVNENES